MKQAETFYDVLGVDKNATGEEIKQAYRTKAKLTHPDTANKNETEDEFIRVNDAWEILGDPEKRKYYDDHGSMHRYDEEDEKFKVIIDSIFSKMLETVVEFPEFPTDADNQPDLFEYCITEYISSVRKERKEIKNIIKKCEAEIIILESFKEFYVYRGASSDVLAFKIKERLENLKALIVTAKMDRRVLVKVINHLEDYVSSSKGNVYDLFKNKKKKKRKKKK